jgi:hypothetical protein
MKITIKKSIPLALLLCGSLASICQPTAQAGLIQYANFETGDLLQIGDSSILSGYDGSAYMSASTTTKRAGSYAAKLNYTTGQDRVELTTANGSSTEGQYGVTGAVNWYGWSMYLPAGMSDDQWSIISQWHYDTPNDRIDTLSTVSGSGNSPTRLSLYSDGKLKLALFYQVGTSQKSDKIYDLGSGLVNFDAWNDFVMEVRWTSGTTGYMRLWVNGTKRLEVTGVPTYFSPSICPYGPRFKAGVYKGAGYSYPGSAFNVYVDEYRHGDASSSYTEVAPGSGVGLGGIYRIKNSYSNLSLRPYNAGLTDDTKITQYTDNAAWSSEQWKVMLTKDGLYRIDSVYTGKSLRASSTAENAQTVQYTWSEFDSQRWNLIKDGTAYRIKNKYTAKVLRPLNGSVSNDADVVQTTDQSYSTQKWSFVQ